MSTEANITPTRSLAAKVGGFVGGAAAITILALIAKVANRDSFAKGAVIGGAIALTGMAFLWWRGSRGGAAAHLANGIADERERIMFRDARADAGTATFLAAIGCTIWTMFGAEAIAVLAIVLWTWLLALLISLTVRVRRG